MGADLGYVFQWWSVLFLFGAVGYPLTKRFFSSWFDHGYLFSKAIGMAIATYIVYLLGVVQLMPFTVYAILVGLAVTFIIGIIPYAKDRSGKKLPWKTMIIEEVLFFGLLLFWSFIKAHEPDIRGLEKFMDYGFMKSIMETSYFPAPDLWYAGLPINYYYFGHTVVAVLTKFGGMDLAVTFNLMLATIFALTATMSFSIGFQLIVQASELSGGLASRGRSLKALFGGVFTAFLVTLAGNLQTIYAFTTGYNGEDTPPPFWTILSPLGKIRDGLLGYWYPNATRFIPFSIHEFPAYSFVVSDIHGHVLSLPFALLAIALVVSYVIDKTVQTSWYAFYGFLVAILLMTNALDGPIYLGLFLCIFLLLAWKNKKPWKSVVRPIAIIIGVAGIVASPFLYHFKSFVSGIAVNCPPSFVSNTKLGPLIFEEVEKCQRSAFWMWWLLWGFFIFCGLAFIKHLLSVSFKDIIKNRSIKWSKMHELIYKVTHIDLLLLVFFLFSLVLVIFPEFFYFKDIYPAHFRSNTMFKLGYEAFILFSVVSGFVIVQAFSLKRILFLAIVLPQVFLVSIYPIFAVRSYFNSLSTYKGLYGLSWLASERPDDFAAIEWLNGHAQKVQYAIEGRPLDRGMELIVKPYTFDLPVIVEADGDSYTDYERVSAFTGLPTVVGWAVHEWLWRGSYDVVSPRREDVRRIYESVDLQETRALLDKYKVVYVIVGSFEHEKFLDIQEWKFEQLGHAVFTQGETVIYEVRSF